MPHLAYTHLVLESERSLVVAGPHFHVLNALTGEILRTTTSLEGDARQAVLASGPIRCLSVDAACVHVATAGDDKKLKVWNVTDALELLSERELPKKPTELAFTRDGQTIVVSDKFGDVFSYPLHPDSEPTSSSPGPAGASKRGSLTSHENPSNGTLVLGHASLLTTFLLTPDEQYIITADRDEHIRVSWFPQGYVIERYCLGHEKFVSAVHLPSFEPSLLVSGGGDPVLKVWDWMSGKLLSDIPVFETVEPFIKVKAPKRRRGWNDAEGSGEADGGDSKEQKKGKGKGRRNRGKGQTKGKDRDASEDAPDVAEGQGEEKVNETRAAVEEGKEAAAPPEDELVFVVHRIQSVDRGEHGRFIVFSVVGATALFYAAFPDSSGTVGPVQAVDTTVPVLDFTVGPNGDIWTLVDANWNGRQSLSSASTPSEDTRFVRLLVWDGATLSESSDRDVPLLATLSSKTVVPATAEDLAKLDLYSDLLSMPKNVDPEHDPLIRDTLEEAAAMDVDAEGKNLTQRELGRLKKKKALLAKIQEQGQQKRGASADVDVEAEREIKRSRSDSEGGVGNSKDADDARGGAGVVEDVEMEAS